MIELDSIKSLKKISSYTFNVAEINSIDAKYHDLRQDSKAPTFALTYQGTSHTLIKKCGFSEEQAKEIETRYHELYKESDEWLQKKLLQASKDGYVTLAFGLRLKTPLLKETILNTSKTLNQARQEARTAGNALSGQSYGLLNNRAAVAFMKRVKASKWRYKVIPVSLIHDAIYLMVANDVECVKWVNEALIEEMSWQELPEIAHDKIKLGAELELYPSWDKPIAIPNNASEEEILKITREKSND